jgi:hypothetical protein
MPSWSGAQLKKKKDRENFTFTFNKIAAFYLYHLQEGHKPVLECNV